MQNKINQIIKLLKKEFSGPDPEPSKSDPLDVLIATMLSQNTTDKTSFRAFQNLKNNFSGWDDVMNSPLIKIRNAIRVCGLANQKSASIKNLLKDIHQKYGKFSLNYIIKLPDEKIYKDLLRYNGVGVKTVSCVLAFGLGRDVFPVDTHVHRVTNRLGLAKSNQPEKTFEQLKDKIPVGKKFLLHTLLIRFGRKICKAKNPSCGKCILYDICEYEDKEKYSLVNNKVGKEPKENNFIILEHV